MNYIVPEDEQFEAFLSSGGDNKPVLLCHLLRFRDEAAYEDQDDNPCSGREAYHRYLERAVVYIEEHNGSVIFNGPVSSLLIGPTDEHWDEVLLVRFPNVETVTTMMGTDLYQSIGHHRLAGLEDTRLLILREPGAT